MVSFLNVEDPAIYWSMMEAISTFLAVVVALFLGLLPHLKLWLTPKPNLVFSDFTIRRRKEISTAVEQEKTKMWAWSNCWPKF